MYFTEEDRMEVIHFGGYPENHGKGWKEIEDELIKEEMERLIEELAFVLGRTKTSVKMRINKSMQ